MVKEKGGLEDKGLRILLEVVETQICTRLEDFQRDESQKARLDAGRGGLLG